MPSQAIHDSEKEQFVKLFEKVGVDHFQDRLVVLEVFLRTEHHVTAQELTALLHDRGNRYPESFVQETIDLMCRYGFAQANRFDNGRIRYEHRHLGQHHDHLICTRCQKIVEFRDEAIEQRQLRVAAGHGFHMLQHKMELYGICRDCLDQREHVLTLDMAKPGERLKVVSFDGGSQAKMRMISMGLRVGDEIEIITNIHRGQVVVACNFNRLVLGQGLARKVRVKPIRP